MPADTRPANLIGLMAGTSLDGIDAVLVSWPERSGPEILGAETLPYSADLARTIRHLGPESKLREIADMDARLGQLFADAAQAVMTRAGVGRDCIRAIASHGQTVWHAPSADYPTSVQIGDPNRIAERTGIDVVADFRRRDMAAGGQGAPLAPLFHQALFEASEDRAVLNLGGIANITLLPHNGDVRGFDTGPANTLLDTWYQRHHGGSFDTGGAWSAHGTADAELLTALLADPFFRRPPPRSTGPEHFNLDWLEAAIGERTIPPVDVQATLAELSARSAADAIRDQLPSTKRVIVCGGGAHNADLMNRLDQQLAGMTVESSDALGISPDWIEAIGFAWLGRETLAGRPGNAPPVTGARHTAVLGGIYRGS